MNEDDINQKLGIVLGKLDMVLEFQKQTSTKFDEFDERLRSLEHQRGYVFGVVAALIFCWTIAFEWFKTKFVG
jgi:hypothetical protein